MSTNFCSFIDSTGLTAIIARHACRPITRSVQAGFRERLKDADSDSEELSEECRPGGRQTLQRGIFFPHPGGMHAKAGETRILIGMPLRGAAPDRPDHRDPDREPVFRFGRLFAFWSLQVRF